MRILIVRLSAIGDAIHALPLAAAIKRAFPGCYLGWVVEGLSAPLIENNPLVDWVRVLPKGWLKSFSEAAALRRDLRRERFDIVFDPQGLTKSAAAGWLSGAKKRIGFTRGQARELAPILDNVLVAPEGRHIIDMTLSLLRGAGAAVPDRPEFVFPPASAGDLAAVDAMCGDERYAGGFVLMGPWGSFASKLWPLERFGIVAARLFEENGMRSVMLGHGDGERSRAEAVVRAAGGALSLAPDVAIPGVVELARRACLFVGCDSFPMHAASAVGCPTIGLFGVTDPERLGPYGPGGKSVYERLTLVKSTRERRGLPPDNLLALEPAKVLGACVDMLIKYPNRRCGGADFYRKSSGGWLDFSVKVHGGMPCPK